MSEVNFPIRVVSSGTGVAVNAGAAVTLATLTRQAGEVFQVIGWVENDAVGGFWGYQLAPAASAVVSFYFERTATANQTKVWCENLTAANKTVAWAVIALKI